MKHACNRPMPARLCWLLPAVVVGLTAAWMVGRGMAHRVADVAFAIAAALGTERLAIGSRGR